MDPADLGDGIRLHVLPNPSNGHVLLEGRVPAAVVDLASVAIYDVAGRMLVDAHVRLSGGDFAFEWDGRDGHGNRMGTGTYFVRVRAGSEVLEEKITLLR